MGVAPDGQFDNFAFGGKYIDLVGEKVGLNVLKKFQRVAALALHIKQALNPAAARR